MNLLFIKLIQPLLSDKEEDGKIDFLNVKHYLQGENDEEELEDLQKTLNYFKDLKSLTTQNNIEIRNDKESDAIRKMGEILKKHPITGNIYKEDNFIKVREASTLRQIIDEVIDKIDFSLFVENEDIIGEIYEHFLNKYVKSNSKELGQFFTPRKLMKLILDYKRNRINKIFKGRSDISVYDSCMGTGGWLVTAYNLLNKKFSNINVAGGEVEPETYQYGIMNIILTLKRFPSDLECNSSLTHINNKQHSLICTNPPFNSKNKIKFKKILENLKADKYTKDNNVDIDKLYKLKKDDPPIQFLELDTYKLEENGMCIIVLPYGEFFFGKGYKDTRRHFMNEVNVTDILLVPSNTFSHTGIKTCVVIFEKDTAGTKEINFLNINKDCKDISKITTLTRDDIENEELCSWYHTDYLEDKLIFEMSNKMPNYEWVELDKVFIIEPGKNSSTSIIEDENGEGLFITTNNNNNYKKISKDVCQFGSSIFISKSISTWNKTFIRVKYIEGYSLHSNLMNKLIVNEDYSQKINNKFIFYFLKSIEKYIEKTYFIGSLQETLDKKNFNRMKIPIPPLEIQAKIVSDLDSSKSKVFHMGKIVEQMYKDIETFFNWTIEIENRNPETKWIEFGKVFDLVKGKLQSSKVEEDEEGEVYFITKEKIIDVRKINNTTFYEEGLFIASAFNGNGKCPLRFIQDKCIHSNLMLKLNMLEEYENKINIKYVYYFLKTIQEHIEKNYDRGSCQQSLDIKNFNRIKIQIPPIARQNVCIEKINEMETIIKRWEEDIDNFEEIEKDKFSELLESESLKL